MVSLDSKIYIAGHTGMVGSSIVRCLSSLGYKNLILRTRQELDLINQQQVREFFFEEKPEYVYFAAAKVGGIVANDRFAADFIFENLQIQNNIIEQSKVNNVKKLLFLGSSCIYPKFANQPISESELLTGPLEPTNEWYAVAKIAGLKMCQAYRRQYGCDFISVMPTNLYGPNDNYNLENCHVLPGLIRKFHEAKYSKLDKVVCWGTGAPYREFLYVDDLAKACIMLMNYYSDPEPINVGYGRDYTIKEVAEIMKEIVGCKIDIEWDTSRPDGTPRKLLDSSKIFSLGWKPEISLEDGIKIAYNDFIYNILGTKKTW